MSTRSTTHFRTSLDAKSTAIVYRHHDGYPEGAGVDLLKFVEQVKEQCEGTSYGTRFNDDYYLAAKYLMFLVMDGYKYDIDTPLNFGGVGILDQDPGDIEYRYIVVADGTPTIYVQEIGWPGHSSDGEPVLLKEVLEGQAAL